MSHDGEVMNSSHCEKEQAIVEATQFGRWDDELASHAAKCPVCRDAVMVAHFLQELDESGKAEARLPGAASVWWKAQLLARRAAAKRAAEPITIIERLAYACGVFSLFGLAVWQWSWVHAGINWLADLWYLSGRAVREFVLNFWQQSNSILVMSASALLLFLTLLGYLVWTEE